MSKIMWMYLQIKMTHLSAICFDVCSGRPAAHLSNLTSSYTRHPVQPEEEPDLIELKGCQFGGSSVRKGMKNCFTFGEHLKNHNVEGSPRTPRFDNMLGRFIGYLIDSI